MTCFLWVPAALPASLPLCENGNGDIRQNEWKLKMRSERKKKKLWGALKTKRIDSKNRIQEKKREKFNNIPSAALSFCPSLCIDLKKHTKESVMLQPIILPLLFLCLSQVHTWCHTWFFSSSLASHCSSLSWRWVRGSGVAALVCGTTSTQGWAASGFPAWW